MKWPALASSRTAKASSLRACRRLTTSLAAVAEVGVGGAAGPWANSGALQTAARMTTDNRPGFARTLMVEILPSRMRVFYHPAVTRVKWPPTRSANEQRLFLVARMSSAIAHAAHRRHGGSYG